MRSLQHRTEPVVPAFARFDALVAMAGAAVGGYVPLAVALAREMSAFVISPPIAEIIADPSQIRPEPIESALFLFALVYFPVFFVGWARLGLLDAAERLAGRAPRSLAAIAAVVLAALALWAASGDGFFYARLNAVYVAPRTSILVGATVAVVAVWPTRVRFGFPKAATGLFVVIALVAHAALGIFAEDDRYVNYPNGHFEAVFFSVVRTFLGAPALSDCGSQYGLYSVFLTPVFKIVGLSVARYSIVMSLLGAFCLFALWWFLWREIRPRWLATTAWGAMVSFVFLALRPFVERLQSMIIPDAIHGDPYFQWLPIRVLFPVLALVLASLDFSLVRRRRARAVGHALMAAGILWNLEMGFIAWLSWILFLAYREIGERGFRLQAMLHASLHLFVGIASVLAVFALFSIGHGWIYGLAPEWSALVRFQKLFYGSGFMMLPMEVPHTWMVVAATYIAGLAASLGALATKGQHEVTRTDALTWLLSVLGSGVFVYFQGRSHDWVLPAVTYPAWLLAALFCARIFAAFDARWPRALVAGVLASWIATGAMAVGGGFNEARERIERVASGASALSQDEEFLRATKGKQPLFLSYRASVLYLHVHTVPPYCPSLPETLAYADRNRLLDTLEPSSAQKHTIVVDRIFLLSADRNQWRPVLERLRNLRVLELSPSGQFAILGSS